MGLNFKVDDVKPRLVLDIDHLLNPAQVIHVVATLWVDLLTDAGRSTYVAASELFAHFEIFLANVSDPEAGLRRRLTIAVFDVRLSDLNRQLYQAITNVKADSDAVQFEVIVAPADEVEIAVLETRSL
jgi:hypothetical protein